MSVIEPSRRAALAMKMLSATQESMMTDSGNSGPAGLKTSALFMMALASISIIMLGIAGVVMLVSRYH